MGNRRPIRLSTGSPVRSFSITCAVVLLTIVLTNCAGRDSTSQDSGSTRSQRPATTSTADPVTSSEGSSTTTGMASTTAVSTPVVSTTTAEPTRRAPPVKAPPPPSPSTTAGRPRSGAVVVIDPGHNGNNWRHPKEINRQVDAGGFKKACNTTGTSGGNLTEAAFNLAVAQRLEAVLSSRGVRVILTRSDNDGWGPCVDERGQVAARAKANLMVSIHADGSGAQNHGFHVIHPSSIRGYTDSTAAPSARAATLVRDSLVQAGFQPSTYIGSRGLIQRGDLGTLNRAGVPAIMIESGNMKNATDIALLSSVDGQQRLARAIADGVEQFLGTGG